jgi:hypothetical protein
MVNDFRTNIIRNAKIFKTIIQKIMPEKNLPLR